MKKQIQTKPVTNKYHVGKKQWSKWSDRARRIFNDTFSAMNLSQRVFLHPKTKPVPAKQWRTTAWNAAWTAAEVASGFSLIDVHKDDVCFRKPCSCGK